MNDAIRGVVIAIALVALYFALRLTIAYLARWFGKRENREHVMWHVFWMSVGLCITAGLVIGTEVGYAGSNRALIWKDWMRLMQVAAITAGLKPIWHQHQRTAGARRERQVRQVAEERA